MRENADVEQLRRLVPFQDCTTDQLRRIAALVVPLDVGAGTTLVSAGRESDRLYVIVEGTVRVRGRDGLDGVLGTGDVVGELSVLGGEPSAATVVTETPARLLAVERGEVPSLLTIAPVARRLRAIAQARFAAGQRAIVEAAEVPVLRPPRYVRGRGAGLHPRRELPARPLRVVALVVLAVLVGTVGTWVLSQRHRATPVGSERLLAEFRSPTPTPASLVEPTTPAETAPTATSSPTPRSDTTSPPPAVVPTVPPDPDPGPTTIPPSVGPPDPTTPAAPAVSFAPPAPGVYSYVTSGSERIDLAGASHRYPDRTHAVVRSEGGCGWSVEHPVLEEHVDLYERCSARDLVSVVNTGREVEFFGQRDRLVYVCDPPARTMWDAPVGTSSSGRCRSEEGDGEVAYDGVYVGTETLTVGGDQVETAHLRLELTMTGRTRGSSVIDYWLHPETGLTVREERTVDTQARASWGDVHYEEEASFHLVSLTPRT